MNPYPDLIEELHQWLESRFGQKDREATEIVLAAMPPKAVTGMDRPWLIIETDYLNRDCQDAWFALGGEVPALSMALPRLLRREPMERLLQEWIATRRVGSPGIWVEAEWRRLPSYGRGSTLQSTTSWAIFNALCVRLRVAHPKSDRILGPRAREEREELGRLARRVLDGSLRSSSGATSLALRGAPSGMLYWVELAQKLSNRQWDWESLVQNLAGVARGIAVLYGDGRPPDWTAAERLLRDS